LQENENEIILDLKKFNMQEKVIKSRLVLYTIIRLFGTSKGIEKIHIEDIIKLCQNNIGNKYLTPNKNTKVYVNARKNRNFKKNLKSAKGACPHWQSFRKDLENSHFCNKKDI